jgi:hypothetical protein
MENEGDRRIEQRRARVNRRLLRRLAGPALYFPWCALGHRGGGVSFAAALGLGLTLWAPVAAAQVTEASSTTVLRLAPDWSAGDKNNSFWATEYVSL